MDDTCTPQIDNNYLRQIEKHNKLETKQIDDIPAVLEVNNKPRSSLELTRKKSKCIVYTNSSGYSPAPFPKELLKQLSQHERFELQNKKCSSETNIQAEIINLSPPEYHVTESEVQDNVHQNSTRKARPKKAKPIDLFNPYFGAESSSNIANMGKTLLESIRNKVFGFYKPGVNGTGNDDEWTDSPNNLNIETKFPKETRHAMSNLTTRTTSTTSNGQLCSACLRQVNNIATVDAQTSPVTSKVDIALKRSYRIIQCPSNLLCDRGIHLGKCDTKVRLKTQLPICGKTCVCRKNKKYQDNKKKYPGKAELKSRVFEVPTAPEEQGTMSLNQLESDVSIGLEAKDESQNESVDEKDVNIVLGTGTDANLEENVACVAGAVNH